MASAEERAEIDKAVAAAAFVDPVSIPSGDAHQLLTGLLERGFSVIDNETGKEADVAQIVDDEEWCLGLFGGQALGFAITQDGDLVLLDTNENYAECPEGRFEIKPH